MWAKLVMKINSFLFWKLYYNPLVKKPKIRFLVTWYSKQPWSAFHISAQILASGWYATGIENQKGIEAKNEMLWTKSYFHFFKFYKSNEVLKSLIILKRFLKRLKTNVITLEISVFSLLWSAKKVVKCGLMSIWRTDSDSILNFE